MWEHRGTNRRWTKNFADIECELSNHGTLLVGVVEATRVGRVSKKRQRQMGMVQGCWH